MDHSFSSWDPGEVADADNNYDEDSGDDDDDEDDDVDDDDDDDDDEDYDDDDWRWCFKTCPSLPHANPVLSKVNPTFQNEARGIFKTI